jgi:hypothetical protein
MPGRIFRAEALNWPWVSSDEYAGQRYYWQSYLMGTTWVNEFDYVIIKFIVDTPRAAERPLWQDYWHGTWTAISGS